MPDQGQIRASVAALNAADPDIGPTLVPMPVHEAQGGREGDPVRQPKPDICPFGGLALGLAVLSALFAVSYFFSHLAYLAAALAVPLGLVARGEERIRAMGTTAVIIAVVAIIWATAPLVLS